MKLNGKNWNGEWEPAAATWFKTSNGWRLAYGTPIEDRPIGGFDPVWTKMIVNSSVQNEICEKHVRCKYSSQIDEYGCRATYQLFAQDDSVLGEFYHHTGRHWLPESFEVPVDSTNFVNGVRYEDIGYFMLLVNSDGFTPNQFTWESRNEEDYWIQRGEFRQSPCYGAQSLMVTEINPAYTRSAKMVEYIEYSWDCPMTKERKEAPFIGDGENKKS